MLVKHKNPKIDLSNPGHVKLCLLSEGINSSAAVQFGFFDFAENPYQYGNGNKITGSNERFPSYLIINPDIAVGLNYNSTSPWSVKIISEKKSDSLYLTYDNQPLIKVYLPVIPKFYAKKMESGIFVNQVLSLYSLHIASFFSRGWCYFFQQEMPCKFCSLGFARKNEGKKNLLEVNPDLAVEAIQLALQTEKEQIDYINHTAGTYQDFDQGVVKFIDIVRAINQVLPKDKFIRQHVLTFPPNDTQLIRKLTKAGMGTMAYSIEVFDEATFNEICPGKSKLFGYSNFLAAFEQAVKIVGKGNMYANFVSGLESLETMAAGFEYFGKKGIAPSANIFHPDPHTALEKKEKPQVEYLLNMVEALKHVYDKYHLHCMFLEGGSRNTLDSEICKGFFD